MLFCLSSIYRKVTVTGVSTCWLFTKQENTMHVQKLWYADTVDPLCDDMGGRGGGINTCSILHYLQMSEAVKPIVRAFTPIFCHVSPSLGPRGHVKIESDSQTSMLNRLIGQSCHGPDQSSLTPGLSGVSPLTMQSVCMITKILTWERTVVQRWTNANHKKAFSEKHQNKKFSQLLFPLSDEPSPMFSPHLWWCEWNCSAQLLCGWFNERLTLSHERFSYLRKTFPVNLYRVSYATSHEVPSKAISSASSIRMIINHVIIALTRVHLWNGGRMKDFCQVEEELMIPFMSCWEPLKIITHHSRKLHTQAKGTKC